MPTQRTRRHSAIKTRFAMAALVLAGCAGAEYFRPSESATAMSPEGFTAAQYPILIGGDAVGEMKVWSGGARRVQDEEGTRTVLDVGFALENDGQDPLSLDIESIGLDSANSDGRVLAPLHPVRITGEPEVAAGGEGEVHAYFYMPVGVSPGKIDSFRVRWSVTSPQGRYAQRTPFLEERPVPAYEPAAYFYSPFYDPFLYPMPFANQLVIVRDHSFRHAR